MKAGKPGAVLSALAQPEPRREVVDASGAPCDSLAVSPRTPPDVSARLTKAIEIAEEAGALVMEHFGRLRDVRHKGVVDLLTEADEAAESLIAQRLHEAFPDDGLLAEEGSARPSVGPCQWIVDPIDGTTNFAHGAERFAVSIALRIGDELTVGVIHAPALGRTWSAHLGGGAWSNGVRLAVSRTTSLDEALLATGFPYDRRETAPELLAIVERALRRAQGLRRFGAATLDFVDVARGVFDGYWEARLSPWDMAAGVLLVREAGGQVSAYGGGPFALEGRTVVASNGHLHEALVAMVGAER